MKLGFIGAGGVAQTLGGAFADKGYDVMLSTRSPEKLNEWAAKTGDKASVGSFEDAAKFGDIVFIATLGERALDAISLAGRDHLNGKTVIDLTNPLDFSHGAPPRFTATVGNSLGEIIQRALTRANVVKAFNTIGASIMIDPDFNGQAGTLFIAGDSEEAKDDVTKLAEEFGWEVADAGGIDQAFFLEAMASLWVNYGFKHNQWQQAFKLLVK
jgi:predicted dinucleotide-binding enzyme